MTTADKFPEGTMNVYQAIMRAADQIEGYPGGFDWWASAIPSKSGCGTQGCALGWIGFFLGLPNWKIHRDVCPLLGLTNDCEGACDFYDRLTALSRNWETSAEQCANGLRLYAEKYHGHEKPTIKHEGIPDSIRKIFDAEVAA